jgi:hypothetical protein
MNIRESKTIETLMRQASMTAHEYFYQAIKTIDDKFGKDYAEEHPELIGAFMQTAALDFQAGAILSAIETIGTELCDSISNLRPLD